MHVHMVKMRKDGVAVHRRMLGDRYTPVYDGKLVVMDVTDQGLRRQVKVARLLHNGGVISELVDFAQSWLCTVRQVIESGGRPVQAA